MDLWIYVSFGGFCLSLLLWFYLFHKYRTAEPVPTDAMPEVRSAPASAKNAPIPVMTSSADADILAPIDKTHVPLARPTISASHTVGGTVKELHQEHAPAPAAAPPVQSASLKGDHTSPGGISPAVVYLQNLKIQLENLHKDLEVVRGQVSGIGQRSEFQFAELLKRLDEIRHASQSSHTEIKSVPPPRVSEAPSSNTEPATAPEPEPAPSSEPKKGLWPT
jgi:hypothetical protein